RRVLLRRQGGAAEGLERLRRGLEPVARGVLLARPQAVDEGIHRESRRSAQREARPRRADLGVVAASRLAALRSGAGGARRIAPARIRTRAGCLAAARVGARGRWTTARSRREARRRAPFRRSQGRGLVPAGGARVPELAAARAAAVPLHAAAHPGAARRVRRE